MRDRLSLVRFYAGTEQDLETQSIVNGNVYFLPDANDGLGNIAYDLDDCRSWVTSARIITMDDLDLSVPKLGELVVVTDGLRTIDEDTGDATILPGLKIGDGTTSVSALPYLNEGYRVNADILTQQYHVLEQTVTGHIADTAIHHTENARVFADGDQFILQVLNYDSE